MTDAYTEFLRKKVAVAPKLGFDVDPATMNPGLRPHCRALVPWMLQGGRRALFTAFGLHKSAMQLEAMRLASEHVGGRGLIVCPLGVRQEFMRDAVQVPYCAIKAKRRGIGIELAPNYFMDGAAYCAAAERELSMPSLFDTLVEEKAA